MNQFTPDANPYAPSSAEITPSTITIDDGRLTLVDWILCILCSGIGCIVGVVRLIQGKKSGVKMIGLSILFAVLWRVIAVVISASSNTP